MRTRTFLLTAATALLLGAPARGQQADACFARFSGLCDSLRADPRVLLSSSAWGGLLPNPARSGPEILDYPAVSQAIARGVDQGHLDRDIVPVFAGLKTALRGMVEALPADSPTRLQLAKRLPGLTLVAFDRERCARRRDPFVLGFNGEGVVVCPWMTHLAPETLLATMAHELGHFVDPCWGLPPGERPTTATLPPFPAARATDCSGDEEDFADLVGATLTAAFLRGPSASSLHFPQAPQERAAALLYYTLVPDCQIRGNRRLTPFFSLSAISDFLGCSAPPAGP